MRNIQDLFKNRTILPEKLLQYGFLYQKDSYTLTKTILNGDFAVYITIGQNSISKIIDVSSNEEYVLVDVLDAVGEFVGKIRQAYNAIISEIIDLCTIKNTFFSGQMVEICNYIYNKYGNKQEYLWEKFDDCCIIRNKANKKWYCVFMQVKPKVLGLMGEEKVSVLDLKYQKGQTDKVIDNVCILKGYHMNKSSWITIVLDNGMETNKIIKLVDNSYNLSLQK